MTSTFKIIHRRHFPAGFCFLKVARESFERVILGNGNRRPFCAASSIKLGLDDRVRFKGFVPRGQLREFYRDASLVAMSSVWPEPFGAVGLEAMRQRLPVVAFDAAASGNGCWTDTTAFSFPGWTAQFLQSVSGNYCAIRRSPGNWADTDASLPAKNIRLSNTWANLKEYLKKWRGRRRRRFAHEIENSSSACGRFRRQWRGQKLAGRSASKNPGPEGGPNFAG